MASMASMASLASLHFSNQIIYPRKSVISVQQKRIALAILLPQRKNDRHLRELTHIFFTHRENRLCFEHLANGNTLHIIHSRTDNGYVRITQRRCRFTCSMQKNTKRYVDKRSNVKR